MRATIPSEALVLRCSSLPLHFNCGGSTATPKVSIRNETKPATIGSCAHEVARDIVADDMACIPDLYPYAERWGVTAEIDDLKFLAFSTLEAWHNLREMVQVKNLEKYRKKRILKNYYLHGSADFDGETDGLPLVLDWKSGRDDSHDYWPQLMAYLYLLLRQKNLKKFRGSDTVAIIAIGWLRFRRVDSKEVTKDDVLSFKQRLLLLKTQFDHTPGEHCTFCRMKSECPARSTAVMSATNNFIQIRDQRFRLPGEEMANLYGRAVMARDAIDHYFTTLKQMLQVEGQITSSDGCVMRLREDTRQKVIPGKAMPIIKEHLGDEFMEELVDMITIPKGKLLKAVGDHAPKFEKGMVRDSFLAELLAAGAITETTAYSIQQEKENA